MAIYEHIVGDVLKVMSQIFNIKAIYSKFTVTTRAVSDCYVQGFKMWNFQSQAEHLGMKFYSF